jgi:hypothetical protein
LSPVAPPKGQDSPAEASEQSNVRDSVDSHPPPQEALDRKQSLSRMPTLDGLISPDALQMGTSFGKTYKELAAQHRRSLPPAAVDMMKQGKFVVEGVRDGLWTFFEDIRQATVGDEAIHGASLQQQQRMNGQNAKLSRTKSKSGTKTVGPNKDASFWTEFGLDTPGKPQDKEIKTGHVQKQSKDSTDSANPPELLHESNDQDDEWDNWETPSPTLNKRDTKFDVVASPEDGTDLPWPTLQKDTPSKLSRTGSDLIREWGQQKDTAVAARSTP